MKQLFRLFFCSVTLASLAGCITAPAGGNQAAASASYAGDRASVGLEEIVASVPLELSSQPYQNLHVNFAAIINPRKVTFSDPGQVESIVRRIEPRIDSAIVKALTEGGPVSMQKLVPLRARLTAEAQSVVADALSRWTHASDYEVEVVIVSLYLTDASVGRTTSNRRTWW